MPPFRAINFFAEALSPIVGRIGAAEANLCDTYTLLIMQSRPNYNADVISLCDELLSEVPGLQEVPSGLRGDGAVHFTIQPLRPQAEPMSSAPTMCNAMATTSTCWDLCVAKYAITPALGMRVDVFFVDARLCATALTTVLSQTKNNLLRTAVVLGALGDPFARPSMPTTRRQHEGKAGNATGGGGGRNGHNASPLPQQVSDNAVLRMAACMKTTSSGETWASKSWFQAAWMLL